MRPCAAVQDDALWLLPCRGGQGLQPAHDGRLRHSHGALRKQSAGWARAPRAKAQAWLSRLSAPPCCCCCGWVCCGWVSGSWVAPSSLLQHAAACVVGHGARSVCAGGLLYVHSLPHPGHHSQAQDGGCCRPHRAEEQRQQRHPQPQGCCAAASGACSGPRVAAAAGSRGGGGSSGSQSASARGGSSTTRSGKSRVVGQHSLWHGAAAAAG